MLRRRLGRGTDLPTTNSGMIEFDFIMFFAVWPKLLDASVAIGVLGIVAKASELILDSHQQEQFQQFMEKLTAYLIDVNVVKWYPRLRQLSLNVPIFAIVLAVEWLTLSRLERNPKLVEQLHTLHANGWRPYVPLACWQFIMYLVIVHFLARIRRPFTFCVSTLVPILLAIPFFILSLFAFMGWAVFIGTVYKNDPSALNPTTFMIVLYGVLGLLAVATLWFWLAVVDQLFARAFLENDHLRQRGMGSSMDNPHRGIRHNRLPK